MKPININGVLLKLGDKIVCNAYGCDITATIKHFRRDGSIWIDHRNTFISSGSIKSVNGKIVRVWKRCKDGFELVDVK